MPYTNDYTVAEFTLVEGIRACYYRSSRRPAGGNYESHQPCARPQAGLQTVPVGRYKIGLEGVDADLRTARYAYALKVLEAAHAQTRDRYPDWLKHEWIVEKPGWRRVAFSSPHRRQAEDYCETAVREIAGSGEVKVDESPVLQLGDQRGRVLLIRNIPEFDKATVHALTDLKQPQPRQAGLTFKYEDIAPHVVRLDERMLSLLNAEDGRPPLSEADQELLYAAGCLDLSGIDAALGCGANIHALDDGENVLTLAIQACAWDYLPVDANFDRLRAAIPDYTAERRLAVVDRLLERGADINLFGYQGLSPLSAAVLRHEPKLVEELLHRGADPASDQFPEEGSANGSTALDFASTDLYCVDEGADEYARVLKIKTLLDAALRERHRRVPAPRDT